MPILMQFSYGDTALIKIKLYMRFLIRTNESKLLNQGEGTLITYLDIGINHGQTPKILWKYIQFIFEFSKLTVENK